MRYAFPLHGVPPRRGGVQYAVGDVVWEQVHLVYVEYALVGLG